MRGRIREVEGQIPRLGSAAPQPPGAAPNAVGSGPMPNIVINAGGSPPLLQSHPSGEVPGGTLQSQGSASGTGPDPERAYMQHQVRGQAHRQQLVRLLQNTSYCVLGPFNFNPQCQYVKSTLGLSAPPVPHALPSPFPPARPAGRTARQQPGAGGPRPGAAGRRRGDEGGQAAASGTTCTCRHAAAGAAACGRAARRRGNGRRAARQQRREGAGALGVGRGAGRGGGGAARAGGGGSVHAAGGRPGPGEQRAEAGGCRDAGEGAGGGSGEGSCSGVVTNSAVRDGLDFCAPGVTWACSRRLAVAIASLLDALPAPFRACTCPRRCLFVLGYPAVPSDRLPMHTST